MSYHTLKILIAREHLQAVADAQLRQERIDRADLNVMMLTHRN